VHAVTAVALVAGVVALAPFVAVLGWELPGAALPFVLASAALELAYFGLLATAYAGAGLTAVYPVARGCAPVLALLGSVVLLSAPVGALQAAGVVAVGAGVVLVRRGAGRGAGRVAGSTLWLALGVATCIAGYTLIDDRGVRHADPVPYFFVVLVLTCLGFVAAMAARGRLGTVRRAAGWRPVAAGVGMVAAYLLTLAALQRAEAAPVAALRETSVVMATAAAALWGREHVSGARLAGAAAVVAGAAAIALG
jgi:drug/metabolite transporter (DMT)-like permease